MSRPLSASRRSQLDALDTSVDAQAVMAALQAENAKLEEEKKKRTRSAPGRSQVCTNYDSSSLKFSMSTHNFHK